MLGLLWLGLAEHVIVPSEDLKGQTIQGSVRAAAQ